MKKSEKDVIKDWLENIFKVCLTKLTNSDLACPAVDLGEDQRVGDQGVQADSAEARDGAGPGERTQAERQQRAEQLAGGRGEGETGETGHHQAG